MAKSRRTEKQNFMRMYEAQLAEEKAEALRLQCLEAEAEEAAYELYLLKEEEAYQRKLFQEAELRREQMSREAYRNWLLDHPDFDILTAFDDSFDSSDDYPVCDYCC